MSLEPNDLMLFARVVDEGSFSRAAQRVGLPKSTVSRRVAGGASDRQLLDGPLRRTLVPEAARHAERARGADGARCAAPAAAQRRSGALDPDPRGSALGGHSARARHREFTRAADAPGT